MEHDWGPWQDRKEWKEDDESVHPFQRGTFWQLQFCKRCGMSQTQHGPLNASDWGLRGASYVTVPCTGGSSERSVTMGSQAVTGPPTFPRDVSDRRCSTDQPLKRLGGED